MNRTESDPQLQIMYQSDHELVVYKPKGMACEKRIDPNRESLLARLTDTLQQQVYLPHRLDALTCGLVLAARSKDAVAFHNRQIAHRNWQKFYIAQVQWNDRLSPERFIGCHKAFLKKKGPRAMVVRSGGAPSFLEILAIEKSHTAPDRRHVLIRLLTGRYHQIRAMCQSMGIPLCGDPQYSDLVTSAASFYLEHAAVAFTEMNTEKWQRILTPKNRLSQTISTTLYDKLTKEIQQTCPREMERIQP